MIDLYNKYYNKFREILNNWNSLTHEQRMKEFDKLKQIKQEFFEEYGNIQNAS